MDDPFDMTPEKSSFLGCCLWAAAAVVAVALPCLGAWKLVELIHRLF
jgi:hypothetical protein